MLGLRFQQPQKFVEDETVYMSRAPFDIIDVEEIIETVKQVGGISGVKSNNKDEYMCVGTGICVKNKTLDKTRRE